MKIGVVRAKFNEEVTSKMLEKAKETAERHGAEIEVVEVPGAYDTPLATDKLARNMGVDAVTVIGAIIEGDTAHDKTIAAAAAKQLSEISVDRDTPVTLGITGPGMTAEEAYERIDYAEEAVKAAVELVDEIGEVSSS